MLYHGGPQELFRHDDGHLFVYYLLEVYILEFSQLHQVGLGVFEQVFLEFVYC